MRKFGGSFMVDLLQRKQSSPSSIRSTVLLSPVITHTAGLQKGGIMDFILQTSPSSMHFHDL